ncbi:alpha/beta hydrolase family protein [Gordonia sp. DT30]|uniref:alpha/beta hydrolase family protein n=1 Tax=Gordonia sp. DT30 TaxID=3416546 RepID=UPI003CED9705
MTITLRRRPGWVATRTRLTVAALSTALAVSGGITGSVIGVAHAGPDADSATASTGTTTTTTTTTATTTTAPTADQQAGSVYANRQLPGSRLVAGARAGNLFTYWSAGADGDRHLSTGTLYLPTPSAPAGGYPLVVWAHGSRGLADGCAPTLHPTDTDVDQLRTWLGRGYAVVTTDYTGLGTSGTPQYYDVDTTAHNIVDAVRAGHDLSDQLSGKWAVVGEGQGGSAAIALARTAPELQGANLDYRGSAATSIPAEFATLLTDLGPTTSITAPSGWVSDALYTLAAIDSAHPDLGLGGYLTDTGRSWIAKARNLCVGDLTRAVTGVTLGSLFSRPLADNTALTRTLASASTLPTRGFTRPVLMTQTLQDPDVVVPLSLKYINEARTADSRVDGRTYLTLDGTQAASLAADNTRDFVSRVMR